MSRDDYTDPFTAPPEWPADRACRDVDSDVFFPGPGKSTAKAKLLCSGCPALDLCRDWALAQPQVPLFGVWGGMSQTERQKLTASKGVSAGQRVA